MNWGLVYKKNKQNYPLLQCIFKSGNENQKKYCIKLKDNYSNINKGISFEIKSSKSNGFGIYFIINNKRYRIQEIFDDTIESLNESLNKIYKLIDEENVSEYADNFASLECFYEKENEKQKEYCYKLKDSFKHDKNINYEIESIPGKPFSINFILSNRSYKIQEDLDYSQESLKESLNKINYLLERKDICEKGNSNDSDSDNSSDSDKDNNKDDTVNNNNMIYPLLECFFEQGNEIQKEYCLKLKDNFYSEQTIKYEIKSLPKAKFSICFTKNNKKYSIQKTFVNSDEALYETLNKIYSIIDGKDI